MRRAERLRWLGWTATPSTDAWRELVVSGIILFCEAVCRYLRLACLPALPTACVLRFLSF